MNKAMEDKLEKFIRNNRTAFDTQEPSEKLWDNIHFQLDGRVEPINYLFMWRAAAVLLFICSVGLLLYINRPVGKTTPEVATDEFTTTEQYYIRLISERQQRVLAVANKYPDIEQDFESDWKALDSSYKDLKEQYTKYKSQETLHALIQNLQAKANLLNKQMDVLQTILAEQKKNNIDI